MTLRVQLLVGGLTILGLLPAAAQSWLPGQVTERGLGPQQVQQRQLTRAPEPTNFRREKRGTAFFVDDVGHMLTARHAVEECARVVVAKEGRMIVARVVALSPRFDIALLKVPKTLGLSAVFPRNIVASVNDLMFAASYDSLPAMITRGGTLANAIVASSREAGEAGLLALDSNAGFGTSGAPVLDSRGLVEGVVSRRSAVNRVLAVGAADTRAFLLSHGVRVNQDDRPQMAGGGSRAHRAASISARVTCLQD